MGKTLKGKPSALKSRNIKKRTGAKAQSKQISAISRQLNTLTKRQFAKVHTVWQRNMLTVDNTLGGLQCYVCPVPYVPGNPTGASQPGGPVLWTDNLSIATQPTFQKRAVFGVAREAATSNEIYHTGGCIKWQMISEETTFSKYYLYLIRPKKDMADQLVKDRQFKAGTVLNPTLGKAGVLTPDLDYVVHTEGAQATVFGAQINRKYWDVLYSKEVTFGRNVAGAADAEQIFNYNAPGDAAHTALTCRGTITLPAGGMIKNASVASQTGAGNAGQATSWEVGFGDQENETGCYLICVNNGAAIDGQSTQLGFIVHDYYKACV